MNKESKRERGRETHACATRGTSTYTASRRSIARYTRTHNVSRVLLKLLANDVGGVGWQLESSPTRADRTPQTPSLNGRVTNYLGNIPPPLSLPVSPILADIP